MANLLTDIIGLEPNVLIDYARQYDIEHARPDNQFTLDEYLPDLLTEDLEFRIRQGALNDVDIAEYRAFDTPAPFTDRPGTKWIAGSLGPVSRQIPLSEEEIIRTKVLERNTNDPLIEAILDDAERMVRAVQGRIELARGDIIDDGVVTIAENGLTLVANFGRLASMRKTAAVVWSDPTADIVTELLAWVEDYNDENGSDPDHILMPKKMIGLWMLNNEFRDFAAANGTTPQRITRATIDSVLSSNGIPPIKTYDVKVRKNGVATRVLPEDKIYFMPAGEVGKTHFGVTAEAVKLRSKGLIKREQAPGLVVVALDSDHPVQTSTLATAIAVPSLGRSDFILDAEVL
jgi:hypothetical protein